MVTGSIPEVGMSIFQELTPYPRGYEYFPGSSQATNWFRCLGSTEFSLSCYAYCPRAVSVTTLG